jgi:hypothetical protein
MAEFLGDIAVMLEVLIFGIGLVILHYGRKEKAGLLLTSGTVLTIAAVLSFACSLYYYLEYRSQGAFDQAYPTHQMMVKDGMMGPGMMHNRAKEGAPSDQK